MKVSECIIRVGVKVLFAREQTNKAISKWDPDPFTVVYIKGSLLTAERKHPQSQTVTRNSSFFKIFRYDFEEEENFTTKIRVPLVEVVSQPLVRDPVVTISDSETIEPETDILRNSFQVQNNQVQHEAYIMPANKVGHPTKEQAALKEAERIIT